MPAHEIMVHRRPAKAQASLCIRAEPSLFAHMKYGSRRWVLPKMRHLAPLNSCACAFEERVYGGRKVTLSHEVAHFIYRQNKGCGPGECFICQPLWQLAGFIGFYLAYCFYIIWKESLWRYSIQRLKAADLVWLSLFVRDIGRSFTSPSPWLSAALLLNKTK